METRTLLFRWYWKLERRLAPGLQYSQRLYEDALGPLVGPEIDWLDLGCGHQILPPWRGQSEQDLVARCRSIVGLDGDKPSLLKHRSITRRVAGDIAKLPFPDCSFDLVTANMVVEHLRDPESQFREVYRVLRPGGAFLFLTPNAWGYGVLMARLVPRRLKRRLIYLLERRKDEDVFDTYYRANTKGRIEATAARAGFAAENISMVTTSALFVMVPPLVVLELLYIRLLMTRFGRRLRPNIIALLRKV